jgi:lipopolysaccharide export system protein LptA
MVKLKSIRLVLVVAFLAAAMAIAWNFISRRPETTAERSAELLSPENGKRLTKPQYQERKDGKVTFEVSADVGIESASKAISLTNVLLKRYDEQGNASDLVTGKEAVYDSPRKEIRFAGEVQLQLADGTQVFSDRVTADLGRQVVQISDSFRFRHGDASGSGQSLEYRIETRQVQIQGDFELDLPGQEGRLLIEAAEAFYELPAYRVQLTRGRVSESRNLFAADVMTVQMTEQNRLQTLHGTGQASLQLGAERTFSGDQINAYFHPEEKRFRSMEVVGQPGGDPAVYQERTPRGLQRLQALTISGTPDPSAEGFVLREFRAEKRVRLQAEGLGIEDARADSLLGVFRAGGQDLQRLEMTGEVEVVRAALAPGSRAPQQERLRSERLHLDFLPDQRLERARALERVDFTSKSAEVSRRLTARDSVDLYYREGQLERITSRGESKLEDISPRGKHSAAAPEMSAYYEAGQLRQVSGRGGVVLTLEGAGGLRTSSSRELDAGYSPDGSLAQIVQRGDVRIRDEGADSRFELRAEQSNYDAPQEVITATGTPPPVLKYLAFGAEGKEGNEAETTAQRIDYDRRSDTLRAYGAVRTLLTEGGDLIVVQADLMEADRESGWAVFSGEPRITQNTGSLAGRVIRYNAGDQRLVVEEKVTSTLTDQSGKKYRVESDHLVYDRQAGRARYEGSVEVTSVDFNLKAPFVELILSEENGGEVSEVTAWGGVEILQGESRARGQRASFYPETQKVVMTAG